MSQDTITIALDEFWSLINDRAKILALEALAREEKVSIFARTVRGVLNIPEEKEDGGTLA